MTTARFPASSASLRRRSARTYAAFLIFLLLFTIGLVGLSIWYLIPAMRALVEADQAGDRAGGRAIGATGAIVLAVVLFVLVAGVLLTVRIGRFFFPRPAGPRTRTKYVDAWTESGKRMATPPPDSEENEGE